MTNDRGNSIPNQFEIRTNKGVYFQSYDSIIAFWDNKGQIFLDSYYWDYSRTTGRYRNQFLGENIKETRRKIKSKEYILKDLNG
tara:strand:+ start:85 stop:336 length:252 start_codon:yes stop_codon:yes gene_type:complete